MSWQDLIPLSELEENWVTPAELNGRQLAIYHSATGIHKTFENRIKEDMVQIKT